MITIGGKIFNHVAVAGKEIDGLCYDGKVIYKKSTGSITGTGKISFTALLYLGYMKLTITGKVGVLYPEIDLYPSNDLYPVEKVNLIYEHNDKKSETIALNFSLNTYQNVSDEFVIEMVSDLKNNVVNAEAYINRKISLASDGTKSILSTPKKEEVDFSNYFESNRILMVGKNTYYIENFDNLNYKADYDFFG